MEASAHAIAAAPTTRLEIRFIGRFIGPPFHTHKLRCLTRRIVIHSARMFATGTISLGTPISRLAGSNRMRVTIRPSFDVERKNFGIQSLGPPPMKKNVWRAVIEVGFIIFLFYSNLLMGEFERSGMGQKKGVAWAIGDVFTAANFEIAMVAALIGYVLFEFLRKKF